ncbi:MAG: alkaline phosphatase family protein, partial [Bacteroidota bacterium]
ANRGYPDTFVQQIDHEIGPSKGWPNISYFTSGKISDSTLVDEIHAEMDYVMDAFFFAAKKETYNLIMIDYPVMDRLGHAFLGLRASSQSIQKHYQQALNRLEKDLSRIEDYAKLNEYELIITSGHGFSPLHTSIDLDEILQEAGVENDTKKNDWQVLGVPGKVSAGIYLNDQLSQVDQELVLKKLEDALKTVYHSTSQQTVFEEILRKDALKDIGLLNKNAGDLYLLLKPGFIFEDNDGHIFGIPTFKGDHGYSLKHEDGYGILIADTECKPCLSTDIAKIIEKKLQLN